jgi:hypothetical protein
MCKDRFPDQQWVVADMRVLSLDRRFDGILAWDSFFTCPRKTSVGCSRSSAGMPDQRRH